MVTGNADREGIESRNNTMLERADGFGTPAGKSLSYVTGEYE
jgi:hypothetical protein